MGVEITGREARDLEEEFKKLDLNHDNKLSLSEFDKVNFINKPIILRFILLFYVQCGIFDFKVVH